VRDNFFCRFVVSASLETSGQGGGDADAGGAVLGDENCGLGASGGEFDADMADTAATA